MLVLDMGNVLVYWDPRHLYRKLIPDPESMEHFLATVCTPGWNHRQDMGRPFREAIRELQEHHPEHVELISAWWDRWDEMVPTAVPGMPDLVTKLRSAGTPVYVLTNCSTETYPRVVERFPFVAAVDGVLVSGEHGVAKPDPAIYALAARRFGFEPGECVFVDDMPVNVEAARSAGWEGVVFSTADSLESELVRLGLL